MSPEDYKRIARDFIGQSPRFASCSRVSSGTQSTPLVSVANRPPAGMIPHERGRALSNLAPANRRGPARPQAQPFFFAGLACRLPSFSVVVA